MSGMGCIPRSRNMRQRNKLMDELAEKAGSKPNEIKRSMMIGCEFGRDDAEVELPGGETNQW